MKARTAAAKRKAKRGRKKVLYVAREPNGRISRSGKHHEPADVVALEARRRMYGLSAEEAKDQKAGSFIGYLNLIGRQDGISDAQYEAGVNFLSLYHAYQRALQSPGRVVEGGSGVPSGEITEAYEEWARDTIEAYDRCRKAIEEAQYAARGSNLWAALDYCIIRDERHYHMLGDLRLLLNALAKHFRT